jgi:hypothetical protein
MAKGTLASKKRRNLKARMEALPERKWCAYCDHQAASWDHVIPRKRRKATKGHPIDDNLLPACLKCNQSKGCHPLIVFLALKQNLIHQPSSS